MSIVVVVGFTQSAFTVSEESGRVRVCVNLRNGSLGTELPLQIHTHSGTAQGEYQPHSQARERSLIHVRMIG